MSWLRQFFPGFQASTKPKLRFVSESWGGILTFQPPAQAHPASRMTLENQIPRVGVCGVKTCVGLYLRISETRAFVAHINAYKHSGPNYPHWVYPVDKYQGQELRERVRKRLKAHALYQGWSASDVDKGSMIMVCPEPFRPMFGFTNTGRLEGGPSDVKQVGWYVAEGIKDFLDLPSDAKPDTAHEGFIVDHVSGKAELLPSRLDKSGRHEAMAEYQLQEADGLQRWELEVGTPSGAENLPWYI